MSPLVCRASPVCSPPVSKSELHQTPGSSDKFLEISSFDDTMPFVFSSDVLERYLKSHQDMTSKEKVKTDCFTDFRGLLSRTVRTHFVPSQCCNVQSKPFLFYLRTPEGPVRKNSASAVANQSLSWLVDGLISSLLANDVTQLFKFVMHSIPVSAPLCCTILHPHPHHHQ